MSSGTEIGWLTNCEYTLAQEWWTPTPLLSTQVAGQRLGIDLWLKREDSTPIGSFKLRGALVCMDILNSGLPKAGVYVASAGNYGIAIAVAGRRRGIPVKVFAPVGATPSKLERIRLSGATLITVGDDFDTAKSVAREAAIEDGAVFWEDGVVPQMSHGAATIGTEILRQGDEWDLVLVPSAKKEDKNLTPVGYVVYNDDSELWQREVGKEPPANIVDNTKIILAPNGSATPGDKKLINDFFDKLWQIKQVIWKEV